MLIINSKSLHLLSSEPLPPLFVEVITRLIRLGVGVVYITPDHHVFIRLCPGCEQLRGALNTQKEGKEAGFNVIARRAPKRGKYSLYADLPDCQLYTLPIVKKEAATMSDAERLNIERNTLVLKRLHAIERDPVRLAHYRRLYRAHRLNPTAGGYKKLCTTFRCFLITTLHLELTQARIVPTISAVQSASTPALDVAPLCNRSSVPQSRNRCPVRAISMSASRPISSIAPAWDAGISPARRAHILHFGAIRIAAHSLRLASRTRSRPLIRLPIKHRECA